jgi:PTS system glucose-specific IIC component
LISVTKDGDVVTGCNFLFYHLNADEYSAIFTTNIGIPSLSTSVFGGIIIGTITAFAFNKFKNIQLPNAIGFFSGIRFVPIVLFGFLAIVSILFAIGWPIIGIGLYNLGIYMAKAPGGLNSFGIAFMNRALLPFGLHFIVTTLVNYTVVGGVFHLD